MEQVDQVPTVVKPQRKFSKFLIPISVLIVVLLGFGLYLSRADRSGGFPLFITGPEIGEEILVNLVTPCLWNDTDVCQNGSIIKEIDIAEIKYTMLTLQSSISKYEEEITPGEIDALVNPVQLVDRGPADELTKVVLAVKEKGASTAQESFFIAMKTHRINWKIMATLMDLVSNGFSLTAQDEGEFENIDFLGEKSDLLLNQLMDASIDLIHSKIKYDEILKDTGGLESVSLSNNKSYKVSTDLNSESLAIYDYLAGHLSDEEFRVAAFAAGKSKDLSFVGRYQLLFRDNPTDP